MPGLAMSSCSNYRRTNEWSCLFGESKRCKRLGITGPGEEGESHREMRDRDIHQLPPMTRRGYQAVRGHDTVVLRAIKVRHGLDATDGGSTRTSPTNDNPPFRLFDNEVARNPKYGIKSADYPNAFHSIPNESGRVKHTGTGRGNEILASPISKVQWTL